MIELWAIYDHPRNISLFAAVRSVIAKPDELLEAGDMIAHTRVSSDINAIRRQLRRDDFWCYGRDLRDVPDLIEVWLKRHVAGTTYRQAPHKLQPKKRLDCISESPVR